VLSASLSESNTTNTTEAELLSLRGAGPGVGAGEFGWARRPHGRGGRIIRSLPVAPGNRGEVKRPGASSASGHGGDHHDEQTKAT
jgi:hypothetical protein